MKKHEIYENTSIDDNGCWNWLGGKDGKGYGVCYVPYRTYAHRLSYELSTGKSPKGMSVCHRCDNPNCINPDHLWLGSHAENMADMKAKGRDAKPPIHSGQDHWRYKYPEKIQRGEAQANAKLTDAQVIQMRLDYLAGRRQEDIATDNGISSNSVRDITLGRSWKHLLGVDGAPTLEELKAFAKQAKKTNAKVTQEIATEIRRRLSIGEIGKDLAVEFGIHKATVSDIKLRKIWPD